MLSKAIRHLLVGTVIIGSSILGAMSGGPPHPSKQVTVAARAPTTTETTKQKERPPEAKLKPDPTPTSIHRYTATSRRSVSVIRTIPNRPVVNETYSGWPVSKTQSRARELMDARWPDSQWSCLEQLWGPREGAWQPGRLNDNTRKAVGPPQANPPYKVYANFDSMAKIHAAPFGEMHWYLAHPNPEAELQWGISYVAAAHGGSPCSNLSFRDSNGWY